MKRKIIFTAAILLLCTGLFVLYKGLQPNPTKSSAPTENESMIFKNSSSSKPQAANKNGNNSSETDKNNQAAAPSPSPSPKPGKTPGKLPDNFKVIDTVSNKVLLSTRMDFNGTSAGDATLKALNTAGIKYKASTTGGAMYVSMIGGIFERSAGPSSGWCYYVNGTKPGKSASSYNLNKNDVLEWRFQKDGLNN